MDANREAIEDFKPRSRLFGRHGKGYNKSLDVITFPAISRMYFVVSDHRTEIYTGPDLDEAIDIYNKITV